MQPAELARQLREELEEALAELGGGGAPLRLRAVEPPVDLGADTCFRLAITAGRRVIEIDLPTGLAVAYLADEEAAVDEWKRWVAELRSLLE